MKVTAYRPALMGIIASGMLLGAMQLGGCDRSRDVPKPNTPPEQQQDEAAQSRNPQTAPADASEIDKYAQQAQEPDRDRSVAADSGEAGAMAQFAMVKKAVAQVNPTAAHQVKGTVTFAPDEGNRQMDIHIVLSGLTPGKHGLHIHQNGDCSASDASSAGAHFNPYQMSHGSPQGSPHHLGDLGNIEADASGQVDTTVQAPELAFSGPASVLEKAVIVHAGEDDLKSDPAGNSGDRVGCGVIRPDPEVLAGSLKDSASPGK